MSACAVVSLALLAPCWWQQRIQAGDLSSHIYNAWLAERIRGGQAPGLVLVPQATNVLFDWMLSALFRPFGPGGAQRIAVSVSVLVFFWGAFAFAGAASRRRPWYLTPCLAMLSYGWVFHTGLFNFYLSLGLCLWALAALWRGGGRRMLAAGAFAAVAFSAHALPVCWAAALGGYILVARRLRPRHRPRMALAGLAALVALRLIVSARYPYLWAASQALNATGIDQVWVFGRGYLAMAVALAAVWGALLLGLSYRTGARRLALRLPTQLWFLTAAGIFLIPKAILLPAYNNSLGYIAQRMSLAVAVLACAVLASYRPRRWEAVAVAALAALYFGGLYASQRAVNRLEDRMEAAVAHLPPGQRVLSMVSEKRNRVSPLLHMIDRVCVGRCFSYANYEPSTAQFRVRVAGPNAFVAYKYNDSWDMQEGVYIVRGSDLPLWAVDLCGGRDNLCVKPLQAGARTGLRDYE